MADELNHRAMSAFGAYRDAYLFERKSSPVSETGEHLFDDPIFSEGAGTLIQLNTGTRHGDDRQVARQDEHAEKSLDIAAILLLVVVLVLKAKEREG